MKKITKQIEFTQKEDIGNTTPITYKSYITGLSGQPYKNFIMLAELIDNSISSFENKYGDEWKEVLDMEINIDFEGEIVESDKPELNYKYIKDSKIVVTDNGFGMENEFDDPIELALKKSLVLDNPNQRSSDKNVFGRGMKQCAYFFGQDLKVKTSNGKETYIAEQIFTDENIQLVTPYRIMPRKIEPVESKGTKIEISNIYEDSAFKDDAFKNIVNSLEWRYINYIKKDNQKLRIKYTFKGNDGKVVEGEFQPKKEIKLNIDSKIKEKLLKNGLDVFIKTIDSWYSDLEAKTTEDDLDPKILSKTFNNLKQLFVTALSGTAEPEFDSTIKLKLPHNLTGEIIDVPFNFWAMPDSIKRKGKKKEVEIETLDKDAGIRFFEGERAITHISIKDKEVGPWMDWVEIADKSWRTEKRFCGSMDLKLIGAKPTVDKSKFKLNDETVKLIRKYVWTIYKGYWIFMRNIMKQVSLEKKPEEVYLSNDEVKISSQENLVSKRVIFDEQKSDPEERTYTFIYPYGDSEWEVGIKIDYMNNPSHIMHPIIDKKNINNFKINVYRKHEFWSIIRSAAKDNEKQFILDIILPIMHLIVKSSIKMTNPTLNIEEMNEAAKENASNITSGDDSFEK